MKNWHIQFTIKTISSLIMVQYYNAPTSFLKIIGSSSGIPSYLKKSFLDRVGILICLACIKSLFSSMYSIYFFELRWVYHLDG